MSNARSPLDRFNERYEVEPLTGCWLWTGVPQKDGYGRLVVRGKGTAVLAHRFAYQQHRGPIPPGYQVDHLCRVRACVNPAHLEAVTPYVNNMRSESPAAHNAKATQCLRGHPFDEANTYRYRRNGTDQRACRACHRDVERRRRAKW